MSNEDQPENYLRQPNEHGEHTLSPEALDAIIHDDAKKELTNDQLLKYSEDDVEAILAARNVRKMIPNHTK